MDWQHLVLYVFAGLGSGFMNAIVGGGSSVTLPALLSTGVDPHTAVATNRLAMVVMTGTGSVKYAQERKVNVRLAIPLSLLAAVGGLAGALILLQVEKRVIEPFLGAMMLVLVLLLFLRKDLGRHTQEFPMTKARWVIAVPLALVLGGYVGFLGLGAATMTTFTLVFGLRKGFLRAMGTAQWLVFSASLAASATFLIRNFGNVKGLIDFMIFLALAPAMLVGAWGGVKFAVKVGDVWVKRIFSAAVTLMALWLIVRSS